MDLNDYATTPEKNVPWKLIAIIGGAVLLVIVLIAIGFRVFSSTESADLSLFEQDQITQAETMIEKCNGEEGCETEALQDAAALTGSTEYCMELDGDELDDCIWGVAKDEQDVELCAELSIEVSQTLCRDGVYRDLAYQTDDVTYCEKLSTQEKVDGCTESIQGSVTAISCSDEEHGEDTCEFLRITEEATDKQDRSICDQLPEESQASCEDFVLTDDPDFDGLSTSRESKYGSDPYNEDTDGDGYTDGSEVEAGYSPTGSGLLE